MGYTDLGLSIAPMEKLLTSQSPRPLLPGASERPQDPEEKTQSRQERATTRRGAGGRSVGAVSAA